MPAQAGIHFAPAMPAQADSRSSSVMPAQAGIQWHNKTYARMDSRLRGNDEHRFLWEQRLGALRGPEPRHARAGGHPAPYMYLSAAQLGGFFPGGLGGGGVAAFLRQFSQ
jgi:hypothetical protein